MRQLRASVAEYKDKVDFGIITIREDEWEAILQRIPREALAVGRQTYAISRLQTVNDEEYVIASVRCPEPGNGQGLSVARTLMDELNPQWILLVGIAGSLPDYEYTLGDVLLASRLHDFCVSAAMDTEDNQLIQQFAGGGGPMMPEVQSLVGALQVLFLEEWNSPEAITVPRPQVKLAPANFYGDADWKKKVRACLERYFGRRSNRKRPKAFSGSIASSDILLKSTKVARQWLSTNRQIKGVEMELAGVYKAAWDYQKPVLAIRGISDIVGFNRSPDWTEYACHSAAAFTVALLRYQPTEPLSVKRDSQNVEARGAEQQQNQRVGVFRNKPPDLLPVKKRELLFSNLQEVTYFPETLYSVQTNCEDRKSVWALLNAETDDPPNDWVYMGKMLYAFHAFSDPMWQKVCDVHTVEPQSTSHWSNSRDNNRVWEFIELLKGCLRDFGKTRDLIYIYKKWVNGEKKKFNYLCFAPTKEFSESGLLQVKDFIEPASFISNLKRAESALAKRLLESLPPETQDEVKAFTSLEPPSRSSLANLVSGLNELMKTSFYEPSLFDGIHLRKDTNIHIEKGSSEEKDVIHLNRLLLEDAYRGILGKRYLVTRSIVEQSISKASPRDVFKAYFTDSGKFRYYRHSAFRYHFVRIEGKWYLEITPTYHYTWNGYSVSSYYEEELKNIKRMEKNEAVFRQVMFWSRVLQDTKSAFLQLKQYPYLRFGELLEFEFDYGVLDDLWAKKESVKKAGDDAPRKRGRRARGRRRRPDDNQPSSSRLFT